MEDDLVLPTAALNVLEDQGKVKQFSDIKNQFSLSNVQNQR